MSEPESENPLFHPAPHRMARSVWLYLGCALLIAMIVVFDLNTDPEISLSVFYVIPVVLAAWYGGQRAGTSVAVASAVAWYFEDAQEHQYTHPMAAYWEATVRVVTYALITYLLSRLRASIQAERVQSAKVSSLNADLERRVEERTRALESNLRDLEEFTYTMAHDLRTPSRHVLGFTDILREDFEAALGGDGQEYLERISVAAERMDRLVLDLLSYSRLMYQTVTFENVELGPLLEEVNSSMSQELARRGAEVVTNDPLPAVRAERDLLTVALKYLVSNALENVEDQKRPRIEIRGDRLHGRVRIQVWDNGRGISAEQSARLFRPGQRLHSGAEGTGMALAIARKAAERMGGHAGTEANRGEGNCVWIDLLAV
jgi:signal transduction histidine kinase